MDQAAAGRADPCRLSWRPVSRSEREEPNETHVESCRTSLWRQHISVRWSDCDDGLRDGRACVCACGKVACCDGEQVSARRDVLQRHLAGIIKNGPFVRAPLAVDEKIARGKGFASLLVEESGADLDLPGLTPGEIVVDLRQP